GLHERGGQSKIHSSFVVVRRRARSQPLETFNRVHEMRDGLTAGGALRGEVPGMPPKHPRASVVSGFLQVMGEDLRLPFRKLRPGLFQRVNDPAVQNRSALAYECVERDLLDQRMLELKRLAVLLRPAVNEAGLGEVGKRAFKVATIQTRRGLNDI